MDCERFAAVRVVLLDVDGVLTDASLPYGPEAGEARVFNARDGAMLRVAVRSGLRVGLCSGRRGAAVERRAAELGLDPVLLGVGDKVAAIEAWSAQAGLGWEAICYCGDDLPDLGALARVGLAVAVGDAHPQVRRRADWVCSRPGGRGAVAELLERILRAQGRWSLAGAAGAHG
jgi:3-deoxy-D-manno-octulosonate 8-phosphate phosphatase (KDO 8-P phosphatase)